MTLQFGLKENALDGIRSVLAHHPQVDRAILYGSRAKGNFKRGSDIDLTLIGGDDLTLKVMFRILDDLDDLLLPYIIDLSILGHIDYAAVLDHIQRVGVTFYEKRELALAEG